MFEHETEQIINAVLQRTIGNQQTIAVKDILAADIPYPLKTFFRADVETMLLDELHTHHKSSRFRFDHPEIQSLQNQINSALVLHYSFQRDNFLKRLDETVHLLINYLIRPQWTLIQVLFETDQTISSASLSQLLRHFGPYEYLKDILIRYMQDKNVSTFTRQEFASFLWKVDGEYIRRKSGHELARIVSPIYEFLDFPKNTGNKAIPVKGLVKYFEDKGLISVQQRLEGEASQGMQELTNREVGELLEDVRRVSGAFEVQKLDDRIEVNTNTIPPIAIVEKDSDQPLTKASEQKLNDPPFPMTQINDSDRRRFIKKIFHHDEHAYEASLRALNDFASWKEASIFIDEILSQYEVDPYAAEAKQFIEVMFERHCPKK